MKLQWLIVACCAISFAACNNEDIMSEQPGTDNTVPDYVKDLEFHDLITMEASTEEGTSNSQNSSQGIGSRAPENVTENGRPKGVYPLDYLYFVVTNPTKQPTQGGSIADLEPELASCTQFAVNGEFSLQFAEDQGNIKDKNGIYSDQGKIWIKLPNGNFVPVNLSVNRWINSLRIDEAKEIMLHKPDIGLAEIAELVGFADLAHFSKQFKLKEGTSPSAWRKQNNLK